MHNAKRFLKTSVIYMLGIMSSKIIVFFLLPIYTKYLSPSEFGYYDLILSILSFVVPISFFQIWDGMFRFSFDYKEKEEKYKIITNSYAIFGLGIFIYSIVFLLLQSSFNFEYSSYIFIYGFSIAINYLYSFIARAFLENRLFVISGFLNTLVASILTVLLILKFGMGIEALFISQIVGLLLQSLIIEINIHPISHIKLSDLDLNKIKPMIRFSIPLCIASIAYWLLSGYTKITINSQLGSYENGVYSIANKFASLIALGVSIFHYAWNEIAYSISNDENRTKSYESMLNILFKFIMLGSSILLLVIKFLFPLLIDKSYWEAEIIIPIALFGVSSNAIAEFIGTIFSSEKKTNWTFWSTIIASISNILFSIILTNRFGLIGATLSLTISFIVLSIIRLIIMKRDFQIVIPLKQYLYVMFFILIIIIYYLISYRYLIFAIVTVTLISAFLLKDVLMLLIKSAKNK